jgi:hypothetical protein
MFKRFRQTRPSKTIRGLFVAVFGLAAIALVLRLRAFAHKH